MVIAIWISNVTRAEITIGWNQLKIQVHIVLSKKFVLPPKSKSLNSSMRIMGVYITEAEIQPNNRLSIKELRNDIAGSITFALPKKIIWVRIMDT